MVRLAMSLCYVLFTQKLRQRAGSLALSLSLLCKIKQVIPYLTCFFKKTHSLNLLYSLFTDDEEDQTEVSNVISDDSLYLFDYS